MNKGTKRPLDYPELNSSSMKHVRRSETCLLVLPDEILLLICRYLLSHHILYAFYTPSKSEERLHRMIFDYRKKIKLESLANNEFTYLSKLFSDSENPLRPESLVLSNKHVTCLIDYYFTSIPEEIIHSMFSCLKHLTLIDCSEDTDYLETCNMLMNELLFNEKISSIHTIHYQIYNGLLLSKALISHDNLRNVNLVLQTIDDFYILLNGLVPNVQTMIIKLCQCTNGSRHDPESVLWTCPRLTEFTLFESSTDFVIADIKSILAYMRNLIKLTLSIHDTFDPLFCHGPIFESLLNECLPHLCQFHYTMTHQIAKPTLIKGFVRWPMEVTYYGQGNSRWIHIYSLPWPSNKDDKRQVPVVRDGRNPSVSSDVKTSECMKYVIITKQKKFSVLNKDFGHVCEIITSALIDIQLPSRISKVIFSRATPTFSINSIIQSSVRHLTVQRALTDADEMSILIHQFPHVKYLKLYLPSNLHSFINCLNILFNRDDNNMKKTNSSWSELIFFSTELFYATKEMISTISQFYNLSNQHGNLTYNENFSYARSSTLTIWY